MGDCFLLGAERGGAMYLKGSAWAGAVTSKRNLRAPGKCGMADVSKGWQESKGWQK